MTYNEDTASVELRSKQEWLNFILDSGSEYWGADLKERDGTYIHHLYEPYAERLAEIERELKSVMEAVRVEEAEGQALDYLGERYQIYRHEAQPASGGVVFSRSSPASRDYLIPEGTIVQTLGSEPLRFETAQQATLSEGDTSVKVEIESVGTGSDFNVGAQTIRDAPTVPAGVEDITNPEPTSGGRNREKDSSYRDRILNTLNHINTASGWNIYQELIDKSYISEVQFIDNSANIQQNSLNAHEFEVVADTEPGHSDEIAQVIFENMPMGANAVGGVHGTKETGTAELPNGQTFTIPYSVPSSLHIYVDASIEATGPVDQDAVVNNIVRYIGGTDTEGNTVRGKLDMGEDVVYGTVEYHIREIAEVYDVAELKIGTSAPPSGTTNISVSSGEDVTVSSTDINITVQ